MTKLIFALMFLGSSAYAEIVFDGYYKIENNGKHVGFAIRRLDVDAAKKTRTLKLYTYTLDEANKAHEEKLVATSRTDFTPIASDYTEDGSGKTSHMLLKVDADSFQANGKKNPLGNNDVFSTSGLNLLVNNQPGKGKLYSYMGLRESQGKLSRGQVQVINVKPMGSLQVYRVIDFFEQPPVETWIASNGEILKEIVPKRKITTTLVKNADAAIGALKFDRSILKKMFDEVPQGSKNVLADAKNTFPEFPEVYNSKYTFEPYATALKLNAHE